MKKILIVQSTLSSYREKLFQDLSKFFDVTILFSKKTYNENSSYKTILSKEHKILGLRFQSKVLKEIDSGDYDVVILMFDLHWINNIIGVLYNN